MMRVWGVGALIAVAVAGPPAYADECIQPRNARVFASASGGHIFRVAQKDRERPEGTLVAITDNFDERRVWRARLVNVPARILVADDGETAVGIDNAGCRFGSDHSVVIYGKSGRVVADYRLEDLVSAADIRRYVHVTMAGRHWTERATFSFSADDTSLVITFDWGRVIRIDLSSGKIS
jgi:hypothetical protein